MEKKLTFEQKMEKLNEIVEQLKSGELSLEESLKVFEEGNKLSVEMEKILKQAEEKAEQLKKQEQ